MNRQSFFSSVLPLKFWDRFIVFGEMCWVKYFFFLSCVCTPNTCPRISRFTILVNCFVCYNNKFLYILGPSSLFIALVVLPAQADLVMHTVLWPVTNSLISSTFSCSSVTRSPSLARLPPATTGTTSSAEFLKPSTMITRISWGNITILILTSRLSQRLRLMGKWYLKLTDFFY